jgi:hypothetical protein
LARQVGHEVHPELQTEETFLPRSSPELEVVPDPGSFDRAANRGTGPHIRQEDRCATLADYVHHSGMALAEELERLHEIDSDMAGEPMATAPVEALS